MTMYESQDKEQQRKTMQQEIGHTMETKNKLPYH